MLVLQFLIILQLFFYQNNAKLYIKKNRGVPKGYRFRPSRGSSIDGSIIGGNSISGRSISGSSIGGSNIVGSSIGGSSIDGSSISGSSIGGSSISGSSIGGSSIGGSSISDSSIGSSSIGGSSISGSSIGGNSIGGSSIGGSSISDISSSSSSSSSSSTSSSISSSIGGSSSNSPKEEKIAPFELNTLVGAPQNSRKNLTVVTNKAEYVLPIVAAGPTQHSENNVNQELQNTEKQVKPLTNIVTSTNFEDNLDNLDNEEDISAGIPPEIAIEEVNAMEIKEFLRVLSEEPHIAAGDRDRWLADWIESKWREFGISEILRPTYNVLLSYPEQKNPNKISLLNQDGNEMWQSQHMENVTEPDFHPDFIHAFNAYSPKGSVSGDLVYVNLANEEDITQLKEMGVSLVGKIAITRYGAIYRGDKVKNLEKEGAVGVIFYSDPEQVAPDGISKEHVYPNTYFLPPSGVQRGSVYRGNGDPLSPSWTSIPGAYRKSLNESEGLPGIPCQPIGYGDALQLMSKLGGAQAPLTWRGGFNNISHRLGPGFNKMYEGWKVKLVVNNYLQDKNDSNVIGIIRGSTEPDKIIMVGNHRDAWGYGAMDPSSGTAAVMEVVRVLGSLYKTGWRPRRTIVFASWCSEEYGLIGSTEFVEENIHILMEKGVAMLNTDTCLNGDLNKKVSVSSSPSLIRLFIKAAKAVQSPYNSAQTIFQLLANNTNTIADKITLLGSGTDHAPFSFYAGIPGQMIWFGTEGFPTYHTGFETWRIVNEIIDPEFKITRSCSQLLLHQTMNLADSLVLPLSPEFIGVELLKSLEQLEQNNITQNLEKLGALKEYTAMVKKMNEFIEECKSFSAYAKQMELNPTGEQSVPELNNKLMMLERIFILPKGLPFRPYNRHALFSPAAKNLYDSSSFPGINDLMNGLHQLNTTEKKTRIDELRQHLSDLMIIFHQARKWISSDIF